MKDWFSVDKKGLAQLLERRGRAFAVLELISNSWDQNVTQVDVTLTPVATRAKYELVVTDDDPDGFADLTHSFTLFAPSTKKTEAEKRGRFNLGEKLVLALCETATITSTKGAVQFDSEGRQQLKTKREVGSEFRAIIHLTKPDFEETCAIIRTLIPPIGIVTTFNGEVIDERDSVHDFKATIATEIADEEGNLRPSSRKTVIRVFDPLLGETPTIYELGIPVVENGDRWHYDIGQKVPLNMDRDNVKPAYLRHLRTLVLNEMHERITTEDANATWAKEALADERVTEEAVRSVVEKRFGDKVVSYDPSDVEANHRAVAEGYTVVHGRSLSGAEWNNVRKAEAILPAGRVTPSESRLFQQQLATAGGDDSVEVPEDKWTPGQRRIVAYTKIVGRELLGFEPVVKIASDSMLNALAWWGGGTITFNTGRLGVHWFDTPRQEAVDALIIHEFAHHYASNHLEHEFHDAMGRIGAGFRKISTRIEDVK